MAPGTSRRRRPSRALLLTMLGSAATLLYMQEYSLATYLWVFFPLCGLYLVALVLVWKQPAASTADLILIVAFAVVFRLLAVGSPLVLSSDLYRYVWDGRVQRAGINPYRYPPAAEALLTQRDAVIYPRINRPEIPTIYPPVAQMLFALITGVIPDSVSGMKAAMMLFDLGTIGLLIRLLHATGHAPERVVLYAWSPLVVFELAGSGHVDALMLPFLLLAWQGHLAHWPGLSGVMLGLATLVKLYPAVVFPALYTRHEYRFPLSFGATLALGYLPYSLGVGSRVLGYLPGYLSPWEAFNGGLRSWLTEVLTPLTAAAPSLVTVGCAALLLGAGYRVSRQQRRDKSGHSIAYMIAAYLLLVPTTFHPWYVVWLLPFLCFTLSWGWLYLSAATALSYLAYTRDYPVLPAWVPFVEFVPLYGLLLAQAVWRRLGQPGVS